MNKIRKLKLFGLVSILAFALVFIGFHFLQAQVEATKGKPPKPPGKEKPLPLYLDSGDIITTEENALRVWKVNNDIPQWSTKTPGYNSVAVGDVYGDGYPEIVVPEIKEIKKKGGCAPCAGPFKIFLNVYKQGESGIRESTEEYGEGLGYVVDPARFAEVVIDNVDQEGADEVILRTANYLAIFKNTGGMLQIVNKIDVSDLRLDKKAIFYTVTTGNIPNEIGGYGEDIEGYDHKEIIVYVKEWEKGFDEGWIFILDKDLSTPLKIIDIPDISRGGGSLRVADLDGDGDLHPEICLAGSRGSLDTGYTPYVFVWDFYSGKWNRSEADIPGWDTYPTNPTPYVDLDVGELGGTDGEEIVVYSNLPDTSDYQLIIYKHNNGNGIYKLSGLVQVQARIHNVEIGDVDPLNDNNNEIIAAGSTSPLKGAGSVFYLEVFDSNLGTLWQRIRGGKEGRVRDTVIVK